MAFSVMPFSLMPFRVMLSPFGHLICLVECLIQLILLRFLGLEFCHTYIPI